MNICSWCDLPYIVFLTIPTERTMYGCADHAENLVPLARVRALEVGLVTA